MYRYNDSSVLNMSGPNGDPNISVDDGIIEDEDEFSEEGIIIIISFCNMNWTELVGCFTFDDFVSYNKTI